MCVIEVVSRKMSFCVDENIYLKMYESFDILLQPFVDILIEYLSSVRLLLNPDYLLDDSISWLRFWSVGRSDPALGIRSNVYFGCCCSFVLLVCCC
jgi:hypothetical protein